MKAEWKCSTRESGEQYVITTGMYMTPMLFAISLGFQEQQQQRRLRYSGEEEEKYGWIV